jgi:hypothetical protein
MHLSTAQWRALAAIVAAPKAWARIGQLRQAGVRASTLHKLQALGMVALWGRLRRGDAWTLTPFAASFLGVEIVERGPQERQVWGEAGTAPKSVRVPAERWMRRLPFPELVPDPLPGPDSEYLLDEAGEPVRLLQQLVTRAKPRRRRKPKRGKAKRAG